MNTKITTRRGVRLERPSCERSGGGRPGKPDHPATTATRPATTPPAQTSAPTPTRRPQQLRQPARQPGSDCQKMNEDEKQKKVDTKGKIA